MNDAQRSEPGRALARVRWGNRVLDRAVATVIERREQLDDATRAQLREIAGDPLVDLDQGRRAGLRALADREA